MVDLYNLLGIPRDASVSAIKRVYRAKARKAHPDGGGSTEAFSALKEAHDLLTDPARRKRYDETGEVGDQSVDPHQTKIMEMLAIGLDAALLKLSQNSASIANANLVLLTMDALLTKREAWLEQKRQFELALTATHHLEGRFKVTVGENLMAQVIDNRLNACIAQIELLTSRLRFVDEALEVLRNTRYEATLVLTNVNSLRFSLLDSSPSVG